jgi:hypothetical protein
MDTLLTLGHARIGTSSEVDYQFVAPEARRAEANMGTPLPAEKTRSGREFH